MDEYIRFSKCLPTSEEVQELALKDRTRKTMGSTQSPSFAVLTTLNEQRERNFGLIIDPGSHPRNQWHELIPERCANRCSNTLDRIYALNGLALHPWEIDYNICPLELLNQVLRQCPWEELVH